MVVVLTRSVHSSLVVEDISTQRNGFLKELIYRSAIFLRAVCKATAQTFNLVLQ